MRGMGTAFTYAVLAVLDRVYDVRNNESTEGEGGSYITAYPQSAFIKQPIIRSWAGHDREPPRFSKIQPID